MVSSELGRTRGKQLREWRARAGTRNGRAIRAAAVAGQVRTGGEREVRGEKRERGEIRRGPGAAPLSGLATGCSAKGTGSGLWPGLGALGTDRSLPLAGLQQPQLRQLPQLPSSASSTSSTSL